MLQVSKSVASYGDREYLEIMECVVEPLLQRSAAVLSDRVFGVSLVDV